MKKTSIIFQKVLLAIYVLTLLFVVSYKLLSKTNAKYESEATSNAQLEYAAYVIETSYGTLDIKLGDIEPRIEPYVYTIIVKNFKNDVRTDVNMEYDLSIVTTTNLPLTYHLYCNQNYLDSSSTDIIEHDDTEIDEYGTYWRTMTTPKKYFGFTTNQTNTYTLVVNFPVLYNTADYQDIIESVTVIIDSRQVTSTT